MYSLAEVQKNSTARATSSGVHTRPNGDREASELRSSSSRFPVKERARRTPMSVSINPGATVFTRMP